MLLPLSLQVSYPQGLPWGPCIAVTLASSWEAGFCSSVVSVRYISDMEVPTPRAAPESGFMGGHISPMMLHIS
jgi:hypothetical protein